MTGWNKRGVGGANAAPLEGLATPLRSVASPSRGAPHQDRYKRLRLSLWYHNCQVGTALVYWWLSAVFLLSENAVFLLTVHIKITPCSIYGLLGPNGAGKTTMLKMITGILRPTSGRIIFEGHEWGRKDLKYIGALIESPALYGNLTADENLKVHTTLLHLPHSRIGEVLSIVDLENTGKKKAAQFSLGMKQRLGIAIALLTHPKLLILDEPTNGLDPMGIQELRGLIRSFPKQGIAVILSSHNLSEVEQVVDHIGIITDGVLSYQNATGQGGDLEALFMGTVRVSKEVSEL